MTVTDEMVENAAAAIHACEYDESYPFDRESSGAKELLRKQARAALTAALSDQAGGWQDISTAPKDGSWFLAADSYTPFAYRARWGNFDDFVSEGQMVSMELYGTWMGHPPEVWCFIPDPPHMRLAAPPPSSTAGEGK